MLMLNTLVIYIFSYNFRWIDDVWITGIVRAGARKSIKLLNWSNLFTPYVEHIHCCLKELFQSCQFWAAPSNDSVQLIESFGNFSRFCYQNVCQNSVEAGGDVDKNPNKKCHLTNPYFINPESRGIGHVFDVS